MAAPVHFWSSDQLLVERTNNKSLIHNIFIEGPAGASKKETMNRLKLMGYEVVQNPIGAAAVAAIGAGETLDLARLSSDWLAQFCDTFQQKQLPLRNGQDFKDNIVFYHRSPLSPWVYDTTRPPISPNHMAFRALADLKVGRSVSTLLCITDDIKLQERLGIRSELAPHPSEKRVRTLLGETSAKQQEAFASRFNDLEKAGYFDATLNTTDAKQGAVQVLRILGIDPWAAFKQQFPAK